MRRVEVTITGRVQGVGFRWQTVGEATRRGLTGWVRNDADGSVRAEIQGPDDDVAAMLTWLADDPGASSVTDVAVRETAPADDRGFQQR